MRPNWCALRKAIFMGAILGMQTTTTEAGGTTLSLFDFTTLANVDNWIEISDTVREVGMSKAVLTLQKTNLFQRGIFFTLLNPQKNGAAFAGVRTKTHLDLTGYNTIEMVCRAQGMNASYKIVLRHKGMSDNNDISYEQFFSVPISDPPEFVTIGLEVANFLPYFRGKQVPDAEPLDTSNITMFGVQIYGGVYSVKKQRGVSSLEIETIVAKAS